MKTSVFILVIGLLVSFSISAQTKLNFKTDSLFIKKDTLHNQLKMNNPFENERLHRDLPYNNYFKSNPNLAVIPNHSPSVFHDPNFRMPVVNPKFRSNMPVVKPDSTVNYFLRIKKIGSPVEMKRLK